MNLRTMLRLSPEAITRPGWLWQYARTLRPPNLRVPNQGKRGEPGPPFFAAYGEWMATPRPLGRTSRGCANCGTVRSCSKA
ncbi:fMN-dependent alpha-hydroxy acid dehydrogenase family protein [Mycobacterium xenopi 3993]|nr:fMN-dependent alpha-hydroxy acid dehydrogenase family protein [Mycobacterium xenopi 3993]